MCDKDEATGAAHERLDVEHLHLDDVDPVRGVAAFDVDDRQLELTGRALLLGAEIADLGDPIGASELEQRAQQLDQQVLVQLAAEDAPEDEVGLGVGEDRLHSGSVAECRTAAVPDEPRAWVETPALTPSETPANPDNPAFIAAKPPICPRDWTFSTARNAPFSKTAAFSTTRLPHPLQLDAISRSQVATYSHWTRFLAEKPHPTEMGADSDR